MSKYCNFIFQTLKLNHYYCLFCRNSMLEHFSHTCSSCKKISKSQSHKDLWLSLGLLPPWNKHSLWKTMTRPSPKGKESPNHQFSGGYVSFMEGQVIANSFPISGTTTPHVASTPRHNVALPWRFGPRRSTSREDEPVSDKAKSRSKRIMYQTFGPTSYHWEPPERAR